jgi:hypothetical protein
LGIEIGDSEDEAFWREFLRSLKRRGLDGVRLVISDQHAVLVSAIGRCFQGAGHQRCRVHFARNLMANIPKGHQEIVPAAFRTIFAQVAPEEIAAQWDHVENMLTERFEKAAALMRRAKEEVLAFRTFPRAHWRQIWSTNPLEASEQGDQAPQPGRRDLSERGRGHSTDGCGGRRHPRRVGISRTRYFSEASMASLYPERDDEDATLKELVLAE